jgi:hypothetical protein
LIINILYRNLSIIKMAPNKKPFLFERVGYRFGRGELFLTAEATEGGAERHRVCPPQGLS